jgi:FlaA1/EpsC-like NDP-sugar epimerase
LRSGEKLYEELLNDSSRVLPTHHPKITISKMPLGDFDDINKKIKTIIRAAIKYNDKHVVMLLKDLVPEFISKNSNFESLDSL